MVKIRLSAEDPAELYKFMRALDPIIIGKKRVPKKNGKYYRAYIDVLPLKNACNNSMDMVTCTKYRLHESVGKPFQAWENS